MIVVNYLDQIRITAKFQNLEQIKAIKPRVVRAAGYEVKNDETGIYIASIINGPMYEKVLFIPRETIEEVLFISEDLGTQQDFIEIQYVETQGKDSINKDNLEKLTRPPYLKHFGFKACETEELVYIAQEKNSEGNYRGIIAVPKKYLVVPK